MIARRIVTIVLFLLFLLILELNKNTIWGWILLAALTAAFFVLWETGVFRAHVALKIGSWVLFICGFIGILFLTWPPLKQVPAVAVKDPVRTEVVHIETGDVRGVYNEEKSVEIFAGIPYGKEMAGELRWKEPEAAESWEGIFEADTFAPLSMQPVNQPMYESLTRLVAFHDYKWFDFSDNFVPLCKEGILAVNVYKPAGEVKDLPVLVYIHGGSLKTGEPYYADYRGEELAKQGVVAISFSYRLGVYGYLALPELQEESPNHTTGNYGLLDQILALQWVRDNVAAFGGDPSRVTLAGESAGAAAVSALCTSPLAKGLFNQVFMESSTVACTVPPHSFRLLPEAFESGEEVKKLYGASTLSELRALPAEKILGSTETEHHMTVDGYALTETPYESYQKGLFNESAVLHGYNSRESAAFLIFNDASMKDYEKRMRAYFKDAADEILALYPASNDEEAKEMWAEIYGATFFDYPHYCYNRLAVKNGIPVREYYFSKENGSIGPWHSGEQVYFYGNIPKDSKLYDEEDRALMRTALTYLVNFIKTGDPNGENLPVWPENTDSASLLELNGKILVLSESTRKRAFYEILDRIQGFED